MQEGSSSPTAIGINEIPGTLIQTEVCTTEFISHTKKPNNNLGIIFWVKMAFLSVAFQMVWMEMFW